jgi:hypothetical protein
MLNLKDLQVIKDMPSINFKGLCKSAGLQYGTVLTKFRNNTELKVNEADAIIKALEPLVKLLNK